VSQTFITDASDIRRVANCSAGAYTAVRFCDELMILTWVSLELEKAESQGSWQLNHGGFAAVCFAPPWVRTVDLSVQTSQAVKISTLGVFGGAIFQRESSFLCEGEKGTVTHNGVGGVWGRGRE